MFSKCNAGGMDFAYPDTCNTLVGTVTSPITYPNMGYPSAATPTQYSVYLDFMPAHNVTTTTAVTAGDTVGTLGGIVSGMFMGEAYNATCSTSVWYSTCLATRFLDVTGQNGISANAVGATLVPSQYTTMVLL